MSDFTILTDSGFAPTPVAELAPGDQVAFLLDGTDRMMSADVVRVVHTSATGRTALTLRLHDGIAATMRPVVQTDQEMYARRPGE